MNYIIDKSIIKLLIAKIKSGFLGLSYNAIISPIEVKKKKKNYRTELFRNNFFFDQINLIIDKRMLIMIFYNHILAHWSYISVRYIFQNIQK